MIEVVKEYCQRHVMLKAAYIGGKQGDYSKVAIIEVDKELMDQLWREATNEALMAMAPFRWGWLAEKDKLQIQAEECVERVVEGTLYNWLCGRILYKWLMLIGWHNLEFHDDEINFGKCIHSLADILSSMVRTSQTGGVTTRHFSPF